MKTQTRQFFVGILVNLLILATSAHAAEDPFSKFAKDVKKRDQAMLKAVQQIEERWDRFYASTVEDYYVYSKDGRVRRRANFSDESPEKGFLEVAVVDAKSEKEAQKVLGKAVEKALREKAGKQELLKDQVQLNQKPLTKKNVRRRAKELKKQIQKTTVLTKKGKKTVYSVKLKFVPDHVQQRAKIFFSSVKRHARKSKIPVKLVLAVMHTESNFNPHACSGSKKVKKSGQCLAYGLMQLVPKSGAREAYRYLYKEDKFHKLPVEQQKAYLFKPENNMTLGAAYLGKMVNKDFAAVDSLDKRVILAAHSYNTGPGNSAKGLMKITKIKSRYPRPIFEVIAREANKLNIEELVQRLKTYSPHEEARHYVEKVNKCITTNTNLRGGKCY
jgi:membrane-bound lytic murein transglycosylase C